MDPRRNPHNPPQRPPYPSSTSATPAPANQPRFSPINPDSPVHATHSRHASSDYRAYSTDPAHLRGHASSSSREFARDMPPPSTSPPQHGSQQSHHPPIMSSYGPPPSRAPPATAPPPPSFPPGRDLPALNSLARAASAGGHNSSMSISSMLGGPPSAASRESQPPSHHTPHTAPPASGYSGSVHASPQMQSTSFDFPPFRRPHTPDHQRPYDPRAPPASSPSGPYTTPEAHRFGTPQSYHARHSSASVDPTRDPGRISAGPPPPPRPSSQPKAYPSMPPRPDDPYARRDDPRAVEYNPDRTGLRPNPYDDRYRTERARQIEMDRERERRDRAYSGGSDLARQETPYHDSRSLYDRPLDPRDRRDPRDTWGRPPQEHAYRAPMDHQRTQQDYPTNAYSSAQGYPPSAPEYFSPQRPAHPQSSPSAAVYESPDRARMGQSQAQGPPYRPRGTEEVPPPPAASYASQGGAPPYHRSGEEIAGPAAHQRHLLAIQDMSRKGRVSPLPQAVQGAQPQLPGPAGEPGIKSEFGRIVAGIGGGVGGMGMSSPVTSAPAQPFTQSSLARRDESEAAGAHDSGLDASGKSTKGKRRKLKDDGGADDDSSGRRTPLKSKRPKGHHHHHRHHHHHHPGDPSFAASGTCSFRKSQCSPSAEPVDKTVPGPSHHHHHHHHHHGTHSKSTPSSPTVIIPPKSKTMIQSDPILQSVANKPRLHLGDFVYEPHVHSDRLLPNVPTNRGFVSSPEPLPIDLIKNRENSTVTVKVHRVHLSSVAREEITSRRYLWGTDVYTDDSDVVAACIHGGWIRGEWTEDVDTKMFELGAGAEGKEKKKTPGPENIDYASGSLITSPPEKGPMDIPADRDLHVVVLILPRLATYASTTRYGITSREFGGDHGARHAIHDGLSYMIQCVRWVENGAEATARLRGSARRERMRKAMKEVNVNFQGLGVGLKEGEISASWRHDASNPRGEAVAKAGVEADKADSEGDKENRDDSPSQQLKEGQKQQQKDADVNMGDAAAKEASK